MNSLHLLPFLLAAYSGPASAHSFQQHAPSEPRLHWVSPGIFDAFVPGNECLRFLADGTIAVGLQNVYALRYTEHETPASLSRWISDGDRVLDVARCSRGLAWLHGNEEGHMWVEIESGTGRSSLPLPLPASTPIVEGREPQWVPNPLLAVDGALLVVFDGTTIQRYENGAWKSALLNLGAEELINSPARLLLVGRKLYISVDKGEWGGQLVVADIDTGFAQIEGRDWQHTPGNVRDIDRGPDGKIYVTCGLWHMSSESSVLMAFDGRTWETVLWSDYLVDGQTLQSSLRDLPDGSTETVECTSDKWIAEIRASIRPGDDGTRIPSADFVALAFDEQKRPCLLTEVLGVWRREATGEWTWLTPGWPNWGANVIDLAIVGEKAVISSGTAGVIVVDLKTLAAERVRIE